jgi:hypothetical protein
MTSANEIFFHFGTLAISSEEIAGRTRQVPKRMKTLAI